MTTVETATEIRPFHADIPEEALRDLRRRKELARSWTTDYYFGRIETRLNAVPQFTTEVDGVDIHFIHVGSPRFAAAWLTAWTSTRMATPCSRTGACTSSCASTTPSESGRWRSRSPSAVWRPTPSRSGSDR
jgi:hypothetical protein